MTLAQHHSKSNEHYTPAYIIDAVRETLGNIDLDPASSHAANQVVRADAYFHASQDGLMQFWWDQVSLRQKVERPSRVFVNPPGGKVNNTSSQKLWWRKLVGEFTAGRVESAIFLSFSIELLQTSQIDSDGYPTPHDYPICFPKRRIAYDIIGDDGKRISGTSPPHASMLVLLTNHEEVLTRFRSCFAKIGRVMVPEDAP